MRERCLCHCHETVNEPHRADGVEVRDEVEAFTACAACQRFHCAALSDQPSDPPDPPRPALFVWDGEDDPQC